MVTNSEDDMISQKRGAGRPIDCRDEAHRAVTLVSLSKPLNVPYRWIQ